MILNARKVSKELLFYRALSRRWELNPKLQKLWMNQERGYEGEIIYDQIYDESLSHLHIFRGVYLNIENSMVQCDSLIVSDNGFLVHEIKNYNGNYKYESEKWFVRNFEISEDPLLQLRRTMSRLVKLRYENNINFEVEGRVIFPNVDFALECSDEKVWPATIMRNQLKRYLLSLKDLPVTHYADSLVEIIQSHMVEDPYFDKVADFDQLKKGAYCRACGSFDLIKTNVHFNCQVCSHQDTIHTVVLSAIADLNILFSNQDITRNKVWLLLDKQVSRGTITTFLNKYCSVLKKGGSASYKFKYYDFDEAYKSEERLWRFKDSQIKIQR